MVTKVITRPPAFINVGVLGKKGDTGPAGPQGPPGEPGEGVPAGGEMDQILTKKSATDFDTEWRDRDVAIPDQNIISLPAGENISSGRVVYISSGQVRHYNPSDTTLIGRSLGVSVNAALTGNAVNVKLGGIFEMSGMALTADKQYFAGAGGAFTTDPAGLTVLQPIGFSMSPDKLKINFTTPIKTI